MLVGATGFVGLSDVSRCSVFLWMVYSDACCMLLTRSTSFFPFGICLCPDARKGSFWTTKTKYIKSADGQSLEPGMEFIVGRTVCNERLRPPVTSGRCMPVSPHVIVVYARSRRKSIEALCN